MNPYESTDTPSLEDSEGLQVLALQRIGVFSAFRLLGVFYAALSGVICVLYGVGIALFSVGMAAQGETAALAGLGVAVVVVVVVPVFYGIIGGLFGALAAFLYNVVAGRLGGLEMTFGSPSSGG